MTISAEPRTPDPATGPPAKGAPATDAPAPDAPATDGGRRLFGRLPLTEDTIETGLPIVLGVISTAIGWGAVGRLLDAPAMTTATAIAVLLIASRVVLIAVRHRLEPGARAVLVFFVAHQIVLLAGILANPFLCVYAFTGYLDAARWFRGRFQLSWVIMTGVWCAVGQSGSIPGIAGVPALFAGLVVINVGIAGAMLHVERQREEQVAARERSTAELARVTEANAALQAELLEQAHATGVAHERARLSREIHDTVAQGLVAVIRQLEAVPVTDTTVRERLDLAEATARDCLVEARRAVAALAPQQLADRSLVAALEEVVRRWARSHRVVCELDTEHAPADCPAEPVLLRVAQESLSNVARHAHASGVTVLLAVEADGVVLRVTDDGDGFDAAAPTGGRGLPGMRERVGEAGGTLDVISTPGSGTTVEARIPVG